MITFSTKRLPDIQPVGHCIMDEADAHAAQISGLQDEIERLLKAIMSTEDFHADSTRGLRADNDLMRLALDRSEEERRKLREAVERAVSIRSPNVRWSPAETLRSWQAWDSQARAALGGGK